MADSHHVYAVPTLAKAPTPIFSQAYSNLLSIQKIETSVEQQFFIFSCDSVRLKKG
jgi:hypothetical protein